MITDIHFRELQRERWRRVRRRLSLLDPGPEEFATDGLAIPVSQPRMRLLILPGDIDDEFIEFDEEFWKWWREPWVHPATGRPTTWRNQRPSAASALLGAGPDEGWESYLALYRNGGLELVLGREVTYELSEAPVFRLVEIVGRVWGTLDRYREVVRHLEPEGPWEISLALRGTVGSLLGGVAEGWEEPGGLLRGFVCREPGLLKTRELWESWPDTEGVRQLGFSFGAWVEDSWGSAYRRFLVAGGERAGQFDKAAYRQYP